MDGYEDGYEDVDEDEDEDVDGYEDGDEDGDGYEDGDEDGYEDGDEDGDGDGDGDEDARVILALLLSLLPGLHVGSASVYWPGAGAGTALACGGEYQPGSRHLAMRRARLGLCGRAALVCSWTTLRCAVAPVLDSGPFGAVRGSERRVSVSRRPPEGFHWRGIADLSRATWRDLGRPSLQDGVVIVVLPWRVGRGDGDRT